MQRRIPLRDNRGKESSVTKNQIDPLDNNKSEYDEYDDYDDQWDHLYDDIDWQNKRTKIRRSERQKNRNIE